MQDQKFRLTPLEDTNYLFLDMGRLEDRAMQKKRSPATLCRFGGITKICFQGNRAASNFMIYQPISKGPHPSGNCLAGIFAITGKYSEKKTSQSISPYAGPVDSGRKPKFKFQKSKI
jgi:hypothetical protein